MRVLPGPPEGDLNTAQMTCHAVKVSTTEVDGWRGEAEKKPVREVI